MTLTVSNFWLAAPLFLGIAIGAGGVARGPFKRDLAIVGGLVAAGCVLIVALGLTGLDRVEAASEASIFGGFLTSTAAVLVALIVAVTTTHRQRTQLGHDRLLRDLTDYRDVLQHCLRAYDVVVAAESVQEKQRQLQAASNRMKIHFDSRRFGSLLSAWDNLREDLVGPAGVAFATDSPPGKSHDDFVREALAVATATAPSGTRKP